MVFCCDIMNGITSYLVKDASHGKHITFSYVAQVLSSLNGLENETRLAAKTE